MNNVGFDRTQGFVSDHHKDLLLFLQADEVPEPRLLRQSGSRMRKSYSMSGHIESKITMQTNMYAQLYICQTRDHLGTISLRESVTYSGLDSGVRLDMSSDVGTVKNKFLRQLKFVTSRSAVAGIQDENHFKMKI